MRPPAAFTSRIIVAMRETPTSTRRSDEISFVMNAKPCRSRSRNSGLTRTPPTPQTTRVARLDVAQLAADRPAVFDDDDRIHALTLDLDPLPADAAQRAMVRRRVEVVRHAAVAVGRPEQRVVLIGQPAAERDQFLEHLPEHLLGRRRNAHRDERGLVVAAADVELQDVERRVALHDRVEDDVQDLRVDQVAFGLDHFAVGGVGQPCQAKIGSASGGWT